MSHEKPHKNGASIGEQDRQISDLKSAALEAAAHAVVITDRDAIIVWVNSAFERLTGYSRNEIIGQSTRLLRSGEHPSSFYKNIWDTILAGHPWQGEMVNRRKDGSIYAEEMAITPIRNEAGAITNFIGIKRDITTRKQVEERLFMLSQAVDSSSELIAMTDADFKITLANRALLTALKYSEENLLGKSIAVIMSPNNIPELTAEIGKRTIADGAWRGECLHLRADGTDYPILLSTGVVRNQAGHVMGTLGIAQDITESRKANEKLLVSEEQFRELADNIQEMFFVISADPLRITYLSPAYDEIWGRSRQETYDRPMAWLDSVHGEDREHVVKFFAACMEGIPSTAAYRVVRPDGVVRWVEANTFPVRDAKGNLVRVVGTVEDTTIRQEKEIVLRETHKKLKGALEELKAQTKDAAKLAELVDVLQSCQNAEEAYKIIGDVLRTTLRSTAGALYMTSASRDVVEMVAGWGSILGNEKAFRPDDCWALRRGKVHLVKDAASPLRCAHVNKTFVEGYVCVPLAAQGETLGVLCVENARAGETTPDTAEVLERQAVAVAERISLALANLRLREVLRGQSIRDPLTGLFNRRFMEESLERELRRAVRGKLQVALLMLDIDHFKRFNDTFGHQAGDALLRALGNLLKESTRGQDVICRYGGEEFAFVLAGASMSAAQRRAELLREDVKQLNVRYGGELLGAVTLSIGVAVFPDNGSNAEQLLKAADNALYRAKEEGRDRIIAAS